MPPVLSAGDLGLPDAAPCPFCGGTDTELHAAFGSQLSVATYWCRRCRSAFENFKPGPTLRALDATGDGEDPTAKKVAGAEQ